jgi:hypothetical protein
MTTKTDAYDKLGYLFLLGLLYLLWEFIKEIT